MPTIQQLVRKGRAEKVSKSKTPALKSSSPLSSPSLGGSIVSIAYGIVVLASGPSDRPLFIQTLALVALVVGAILGGRTVQLWRRTRPIAVRRCSACATT